MISYKKLWKLLDSYGMSKTQLMQQLEISSATFAKLSSNQQVNMDILEKICAVLGCSIENIVSFTEDINVPTQWSTVEEDASYLINLYYSYNAKQGISKYLYGFACPFHMTEEGMNNWSLSTFRELKDIYELRGYCTGQTLLRFINYVKAGERLGIILERLKITIDSRKCNPLIKDIIKTILVCNTNPEYRPGYILQTDNYIAKTIEGFRPQVSIENQMMVCESLYTVNTRNFYLNNGSAERKYVKRLYDFLKEIYPSASCEDIPRLGNFEVFSYLNTPSGHDNGLSWRVIDHEDRNTCRKIADAIEIKINHRIISGQLVLSIRVSNTNNPFLDRVILVTCREKDSIITIPLQESPSYVEINLYQMSKNGNGSNLIANSTASIMRNIYLDMHIVEQRFHLEDKWSSVMKNDKKLANGQDAKKYLNTEYSSSNTVSMGNGENESWYLEERNVASECRELLGITHRNSSGIFLESGPDKHLIFLNWLKELLHKTKCKHVVLIDPYVESTGFAKLLRCISNVSVQYDIYTHDGRINEQDIAALRIIAPTHTKIFTMPDNSLHDRLLIITDSDAVLPQVYLLSNSIDHLAEQHASVIIPVEGNLAMELNDYYLKLLEHYREDGKVKEIFRKNESSKKEAATIINERRDVVDNLTDFKQLCATNLASALEQLAYMKSDLLSTCQDYLLTIDDCENKLVSILKDNSHNELERKDNQDFNNEPYSKRRLIQIAQLLTKSMNMELDLLHSAEYYYESYFEYKYYKQEWSVYYAAELLCRHFPVRAIKIWDREVEGVKSANVYFELHNYTIINQLLMNITEMLIDKKINLSLLLESKIPFLHSLAITHLCKTSNEISEDTILNVSTTLKDKFTKTESLLAHVFYIQRLQIEYVRNNKIYEIIQPMIDKIIESLIQVVLSISLTASDNQLFDNKELYNLLFELYSRNSEDICKILTGLYHKEYLNKETTAQMLIELLLYPYKSGMTDKEDKVFYRASTVNESCMIMKYLVDVNDSTLKTVMKEIKKMERNLCENLYSAFLKVKNYSLWKRQIDLFCCLVCIELTLNREYEVKISNGVKEFLQIASNYSTELEKYSEIYKWMQLEFSNFILTDGENIESPKMVDKEN